MMINLGSDQVLLSFEIETDRDFLIDFIRDACCCQEIKAKVTIREGTLETSYKYEHDGT